MKTELTYKNHDTGEITPATVSFEIPELLPPKEGIKRADCRARSSSLGAIFSVSPYTSPLEAYDKWVNGVEILTPDNPAMQEGRIFESAIFQVGAERYGAEIVAENVIFDSPAIRVRGKPDFIVRIDGELEVIEVKKMFQHIDRIEDMPDDYILQLTVYAIMTGIKRLRFWVLSGGTWKQFILPFSEELANNTISAVAKFLDGDRPAVETLEDIDYDLRSMLANLQEGTVCDLPNDLVEVAKDYAILNEEKNEFNRRAKAIEGKQKLLKHALMNGMEENATAVASGIEITRTKISRKFTAASEYEQLRVKVSDELLQERNDDEFTS